LTVVFGDSSIFFSKSDFFLFEKRQRVFARRDELLQIAAFARAHLEGFFNVAGGLKIPIFRKKDNFGCLTGGTKLSVMMLDSELRCSRQRENKSTISRLILLFVNIVSAFGRRCHQM
jgi:hypothetical protein